MADNTEDFEPTDGARGEDAGRDGAFDEMRRLTARRMERTAKRRTRENPQPV